MEPPSKAVVGERVGERGKAEIRVYGFRALNGHAACRKRKVKRFLRRQAAHMAVDGRSGERIARARSFPPAS